MKKFNFFKPLVAMIILAFLTACATKNLYRSISKHTYEETLDGVYITSDANKIVVATEKYHYIFDADEAISSTLNSNLSKLVKASFSNFDINENKITGKLAMYLPYELTDEQKLLARNIGYAASPGTYGLVVKKELSGTRYNAGNVVLHPQKTPLNQIYKISIREDRPLGSKIGLISLTPVTVAVDGVVFLAAVPLVVLTSPLLIACTINTINDVGCQ